MRESRFSRAEIDSAARPNKAEGLIVELTFSQQLGKPR